MARGQTGEVLAVAHLTGRGFTITACNVRIGRRDEIDIITYDPTDQVLVFVEVKTRARWSGDFPPERNLTPRKKYALRRGAKKWVAKTGYEGGYRIDCVCVAGGKIVDHLVNIGCRFPV